MDYRRGVVKAPYGRKRTVGAAISRPPIPPPPSEAPPLYKGGFKTPLQYRAAYEVAAAPRWDDCHAKALIGAGAQMKSSHFVSTGGYIRGT